MKQNLHILFIALALCTVSCHKPASNEVLSAEADSLYAIAQKSIDNYPAMRSLLYYQRALDALRNTDESASSEIKMHIFSEMGKLFDRQQLYNEAVSQYQFAFESASVINDTINMIKAYRGIGDAYRKMRDAKGAIQYFNLAEQLAVKAKAQELQTSIAFHKAAIYAESGNINRATNQLPNPPYQIDAEDADLFNYVMAYFYIAGAHQDADSADYYFNKLSESESPHYRQFALNQKLQRAITQKDYQQINTLFDQKKALEQELEYISQDNATGSVGALYQALHAEREKADLLVRTQQVRLYSIIAILSFVLAIAIFCILLYRTRSKQMRLERNNALLEKYNATLRSDLEVERTKVTMIQPAIEEKLMNIRASAIYQHLLKTEKPMNEKDSAEAMEIVNQLFPDFSSRLTEFGVIKEHEVKMCYLVKMGFKTSRIASLLSRTDSAISNGRMRLYKKVFGKEGKAEDWDKVVRNL